MGSVSLPPDADRAVKDFLANADPELVRRFVAGELSLAFAEADPVARELTGYSIEDAYARLKAMKPIQRSKYGNPTLVKVSLPTGTVAVIDHILADLYGATYRPPAQAKKATPRTRSTKPATQTNKPLGPDEAVLQLQAVTTPDEARRVLEQMKKLKADFQRVADSVGVAYKPGTTIGVLTEDIVDMLMASRRFEPLQRGGMR